MQEGSLAMETDISRISSKDPWCGAYVLTHVVRENVEGPLSTLAIT
jgi:hypothetical protein